MKKQDDSDDRASIRDNSCSGSVARRSDDEIDPDRTVSDCLPIEYFANCIVRRHRNDTTAIRERWPNGPSTSLRRSVRRALNTSNNTPTEQQRRLNSSSSSTILRIVAERIADGRMSSGCVDGTARNGGLLISGHIPRSFANGGSGGCTADAHTCVHPSTSASIRPPHSYVKTVAIMCA